MCWTNSISACGVPKMCEEAPGPAGPTEAKEAQMRDEVTVVHAEVYQKWASLLDHR